MRINPVILLAGTALCLLLSCGKREQDYLDPCVVFGGRDTLSGEALPDTVRTSNAISRLYFTGHGLICCSKEDGRLIQLLDTLNGRMISCAGYLGKDKDFLRFVPQYYDSHTGTFGSYDLFGNKIIRWKVTGDSLIKKEWFPVRDTMLAVAALNDSILAVLTYNPGQSVKLVNLNSKKVVDKIPYRILKDERIDFNIYYVISYLNITPDKKKIVVTGSRYGSIKIYSVQGDKLHLKTDYTYFKPEYSVEKGKVKMLDNHMIGGGTTKVTDKYIYIRTHGLTRWEERRLNKLGAKVKHTFLMVFDLNGRYVRTLLFDKRFYTFDVAPDDRTVYVLAGEPYIQVVKYKIPQWDHKKI